MYAVNDKAWFFFLDLSNVLRNKYVQNWTKNVESSFTEKSVHLYCAKVHLQSSNFFDITQSEHFGGLQKLMNFMQLIFSVCIQYLISTTLCQAAGVYCLPIIKFSFLAADSCKSSETELDGEVEEEVPSFPCSLITVAKDPKKKGTH